MVLQVKTTFLFIPRKPHGHIVYTSRRCVKPFAFALTTKLSGRPRRRLPHAEQANHRLATRVRPNMPHGPLEHIVSPHAFPRGPEVLHRTAA